MSDYRVTEYYDERVRVYRGEWTLDFREPEYLAFQLVLHDYQSSITWQIVEQRQSGERRAWEAERERLLHIYSQWRYYVSRFRGMSTKSYIEATARACNIVVGEVKRALMLVEAHHLMPDAA